MTRGSDTRTQGLEPGIRKRKAPSLRFPVGYPAAGDPFQGRTGKEELNGAGLLWDQLRDALSHGRCRQS